MAKLGDMKNLDRWLSMVLLVAASACSARPVHFPDQGKVWALPMVDPMASGAVVVPAYVHGQGPYLFVLDPDAVSSIDIGVAGELGLFSPADSWIQFQTAQARLVPRRPYEILRWRAGDLDLSNFRALSVPAGSLEVGGRRVHGIIGGELLTRTIVIDIDRDRGMVLLRSSSGFEAPEGAVEVAGRALRNPSFATRGLAVPARLGDGGPTELVVALGAPATALRDEIYDDLPSVELAVQRRWTDDSGEALRSKSAKPATIELGREVAEAVLVDKLPDRRLWSYDFAGVLGQDVLSRYRTIYDRDRRRLWLEPRTSDLNTHLSERLARWSDVDCDGGRCISAILHPRSQLLSIVVAPHRGVRSVTLEAVGPAGVGLGVPRVTAGLGERGTALVEVPAGARTPGVSGYRVVDFSPFAVAAAGAHWELGAGHELRTRLGDAFGPDGRAPASEP